MPGERAGAGVLCISMWYAGPGRRGAFHNFAKGASRCSSSRRLALQPRKVVLMAAERVIQCIHDGVDQRGLVPRLTSSTATRSAAAEHKQLRPSLSMHFAHSDPTGPVYP